MNDIYDVTTVVEYEANGAKKSRWTKIGVAFPLKNKPGFSILLDALPVNGKLIIQPRREREEGGI